jgi:DNA-binding NarL/FixJ family response regulator
VPASTTLARVLLVDDHPEVLRQVARSLAGEFDVIATLPDGSQLDVALAQHRPDLIILDITLPGASGIDLARRLKASGCAVKLVFLTVHADPDYLRAALDAGALGYVVKPWLASDLVPALHSALAGRRFVSPVRGLEESLWPATPP